MSGSQFIAGYFTPIGTNRPDNTLPGSGARPDNSLPGSGGRPDNTLPGSGGRPDNTLPVGPGHPSNPIELPPGIDNSLPPVPGHELPPGQVSPPVRPGGAAHTGYVPIYVPADGWHWLGVDLPHVDHELPSGQPGRPDNTLPGQPGRPDNTLPTPPSGTLPARPPVGPDNTLPPHAEPRGQPGPGQLPPSMRQR